MFILITWLCTFALFAFKVALINSYSSFGSFGSFDSSSDNGQYCYAGYCFSYQAKRAIAADPISATLYTALAVSVINL